MAGLSVSEAGPSAGKSDGEPSAAPSSTPVVDATNAEDERGALEKKLRALRKKVTALLRWNLNDN